MAISGIDCPCSNELIWNIYVDCRSAETSLPSPVASSSRLPAFQFPRPCLPLQTPAAFLPQKCRNIQPSSKKARKKNRFYKTFCGIYFLQEIFPTCSLASMALLQPTLLTPPPLCCCSHGLLYPGFLKLPPKFSNGACCSTARALDRSELAGKSGGLAWRAAGRKRRLLGVTGAGRGPFFGGGGRRMDKGTSRVVGNLAFAAVVTYLAMTGQLRWVIDAIVSLWVREFSLLKWIAYKLLLLWEHLGLVALGCLICIFDENILDWR